MPSERRFLFPDRFDLSDCLHPGSYLELLEKKAPGRAVTCTGLQWRIAGEVDGCRVVDRRALD
jgi:hypothetical protein